MEYNQVTLSFDSIGKALLTPGVVIENIIVDQEKRTVRLWLAIPQKGRRDAPKG
jgi:hypothetical protein